LGRLVCNFSSKVIGFLLIKLLSFVVSTTSFFLIGVSSVAILIGSVSGFSCITSFIFSAFLFPSWTNTYYSEPTDIIANITKRSVLSFI